MNKLDLEKYKKEKEEYDKKIRSLDYKIVETSVELYNTISKTSRFDEVDEHSKAKELKEKIDFYELEKANLTKEIWNKVVSIKEKLREIINNKILENPGEKNNYLIAIFKINKITDVYFNVDELLELAYLLEDTTNQIIPGSIEKKTDEIQADTNLTELKSNIEKTSETSEERKLNLENIEALKEITIEKEADEKKEQVFLIKNNNSILPINNEKNIALIPKTKIGVKKKIIPEELLNEEVVLKNNQTKEQDNQEETSIKQVQVNEETLENEIQEISQNESIRSDKNQNVISLDKSFKDEFEKVKTVQTFNIEEQRVIDFENLLNHIEKTSKDYRTDIERALIRFATNYKIVKNNQYLQNDFDNITNNYLEIYKEVILKFKKDESLEALEDRIKTQERQIKELDKKILINNIEMKEFQRQMQELAKVYFVKNYVKKVQAQVAKAQGSQEINEKDTVNVNNIFVPKKDNISNVENNVFLKIKKLSYDKRMNHIIEVSKWTKNIEEEIKYSDFEESDFQFVIYLIRQTENVCNSNFEQIANLIINFCDSNLQLEDVEKEEKSRNKRLQYETILAQILKVGIENIKKRYSKIPFIGRKVSSILSVKMLN